MSYLLKIRNVILKKRDHFSEEDIILYNKYLKQIDDDIKEIKQECISSIGKHPELIKRKISQLNAIRDIKNQALLNKKGSIEFLKKHGYV